MLFKGYDDIIAVLTNSEPLKQEIAEIDEESARIEAVIEKMIAENARKAKQKEEMLDEIAACKAKGNQMKAFIKELKKQDGLLTEFDKSLWCAIVNVIVVNSEKDVVFCFNDVTELHWNLVGWKKTKNSCKPAG